MKFKKQLLAAAGAMLLAGAASAQSYNWNGYYVGFNVGAQRGTADVGTSFPYNEGYFASSSIDLIAQASTGSPSRTQFHGGVAFGRNWQSAGQVMGYELDLSFADLRLDKSGSAFYTCGECEETSFNVAQRVRVHTYVTARGRWGVLTGNGLLYVTGGLAAGRLSSSTQFTDDWGPASASTSTRKIKTGWALGFGYEQPMSNGWTFKGEYLRVDFGKLTSSNNNLTWIGETTYPNQPITSTADVKLDVVRIGFNKKF